MAYVHIAHDCQLGDNIILANNATLAGHVHLGDWVFLGGFTSVHQFCHIGAHAMTAFTAAVSQDVPPFVTAAGNRAVPAGINSEGLKRRGFTPEQIAAIKRAYKVVYRSDLPLEEAKLALQQLEDKSPETAEHIRLMREFITSSAQSSGDLLASRLLSGLRIRLPDARLHGIGGPHMAAHGFVSDWPMDKLTVRGLFEVVPRYREIK
eukprot:gene16211-20528_t